MDLYLEGDDCPFCMAEYNEFFIDTEGGLNDGYVKHNYQCSECAKEWYNLQENVTYEGR